MCNRYEGCIHYGSQFEIREEEPFVYPPLYMRMRRHFHHRRYPFYHGW